METKNQKAQMINHTKHSMDDVPNPLMALPVMHYDTMVYCVSDVGLVRNNNEDAWKILKNEQFFVLADGMGGHRAGEIASKVTVDSLCQLFQENSHLVRLNRCQAENFLKKIIQEVNEIVYSLSRENPNLRGMGTTLCCLYLHPDGVICAHVGDSRIYRFRDGLLEQITQDHSLMRELIDLGQLSEQQACDFLYKNIITRAIGTEPIVEPEILSFPLTSEDVFLLCTDGLSDLLSMKEMEEIIAEFNHEEAAVKLVEKAKEKGGYDNITAILIKVQTSAPTHLSRP